MACLGRTTDSGNGARGLLQQLYEEKVLQALSAGAEDAPYPAMQVGVPYPALDSPPEKGDKKYGP